jgi:dTDP-4-amino-4,6-dideoxygalactose transaminase
VYHLYVVRLEERDDVKSRLDCAGIESGIHYPVPLHLQPAYGELGYGAGDFPVAERRARTILSLPMFPELTKGQQSRVVKALTQDLA